MQLKEKVIELFENTKGQFLSGEQIAETLNVSRNAIWKVVKSLQQEGYNIQALTNKGYCLNADSDILSETSIRKYLNKDDKVNLKVYNKVSSTNVVAREFAINGANEWTVIIAKEQTAGKGRFGRSFHSPSNTGIYFSVLLRPQGLMAKQAAFITTAAAVSMCEAIENITSKKTMIKWVNDIFLDGKKICGILTEGALGLESGTLDYAVLGLGVNIYKPNDDFPAQLIKTAGYVLDSKQNDVCNKIIAEFLNVFREYYTTPSLDFVEKYKSRSFVLGKNITVISKNNSKSALVLDIDDNCGLHVQYEDGKCEILSSGEISIKI